MKRRVALVLAFLMVFAALSPQLMARADGVCFTVVNETIYDLSASTMPQTVSGAMCVPYTVFGSSVFGLYYTYSSARRTLTFMNANQTVIFDLSIGIAYTEDGTIYNSRASSRGGTIYVPVGFMCQMFGWSWSYLETGPCVRICTSAARVDDDLFLGLMGPRLEQKKNEYLGLDQPTTQPTASPTKRPEATPSPSPGASPSPSPSPEPVKQVAVALYGRAGDSLSEMLDSLEALDRKALVFLEPGEFFWWDEDLLRLVSQGHVVGLELSPPQDLSESGQDAWFEALETDNGRFFDVTLARIRAIHLTGGSGSVTGQGAEAFFERLTSLGYTLWDYTTVLDTPRSGDALRQQLEKASGWQLLAFPMDAAGAGNLSVVLRLTTTQQGWNGQSMTEFTVPRNQQGIR